ncbi:ComEA family DNA-binding protein [Streptomyces sviceus]|uniref:DNA-binding protein n=1 Tax=Streptomyces sviceus (strain ATCC 29083 / DSM 924 / JCM 4929 / NBRC 13980 / NCIMB 11184 / NRRL 5439 / UC 5370) TaxID=463191 RepID=B5HXE1_STRX2|nr:ComEA family DNA-binding protein [Streptomyces sp. SID5470]EDY57496.1 DNA-binding protein [Streptomyces sviceus ATCC 29083]
MGDGGSAQGARWDGALAERVRSGRGPVEDVRRGGGAAEDAWRSDGAAENGRRSGGAAENGRRSGGAVEEVRRDGGSPQGARWDRGSVEGVRPDDGPREGDWLEADSSSGGRRDTDAGSGDWRERAGLALRERMPVWLQTRYGLERRSVVALSVLLVVAAVFALQHFWTGRTQSVQAPEVVRAAAPFGESGTESGQTGVRGQRAAAEAAVPGGVSNTAGAPGAQIVVDVGGKVREPGIQRLPAGSRVADALKAAGGVRPGTNTDTLNRARFLVDGEQVVVGGPPAPAPAPGTGGSVTGGPAGTAAAPVSLNTATVDQLDTLPGVGPVLAQHIVDYRTRHGGFRSVDELREVNGIGDRRFADLRNLVRP